MILHKINMIGPKNIWKCFFNLCMSEFHVYTYSFEFNLNAWWFYLPHVVKARILVKSNACTENVDLTDLKTKTILQLKPILIWLTISMNKQDTE